MKKIIPYRKIIQVSELNGSMIDKMVSILDKYYANTTRERFEKDLFSKTAAICLFNPQNDELIGFSTLREFIHQLNGRDYVILFSGDTIIEKEFWGSQELVFGFGAYMISMMKRFPEHEIYWFLISKGVRTYRYLPAFFKEYYPNHKTQPPEKQQQIMDSLATLFFGEDYDQKTGVISVKNAQYLKHEYLPGPYPRNEPEAFYFKMNPGFVRGDELVCLTALKTDNICDFIKRALRIS
jgi:hypothetical protein